jgi:hypothetical protein
MPVLVRVPAPDSVPGGTIHSHIPMMSLTAGDAHVITHHAHTTEMANMQLNLGVEL